MGDTYSGVGGRQREAVVMGNVDKMAGNGGAKTAPAASPGPSKGTPHPAASSYAPSDDAAVVSHVYGSPIEGNSASK